MSGPKQSEPVSKQGLDQGYSQFEELKDQILLSDDNTIGIVVGLAVGFLTLILLFIWTRRKSLGRGKISFTILLFIFVL